MHEVLITAISQVMIKSNGKGIMIVDNLDPGLSNEMLYGDSLRLQQVLASFLLTSVTYTPNGGQLGVAAKLTKDSIGETVQLGRLEFRYTFLVAQCRHSCNTHLNVFKRITHSGGGVAQELLNQMFGEEGEMSDEDGISLFISRKLVKLMNGDVQYLREAGRSTFIISVELAIASSSKHES